MKYPINGRNTPIPDRVRASQTRLLRRRESRSADGTLAECLRPRFRVQITASVTAIKESPILTKCSEVNGHAAHRKDCASHDDSAQYRQLTVLIDVVVESRRS
jgi:hypothetical protein